MSGHPAGPAYGAARQAPTCGTSAALVESLIDQGQLAITREGFRALGAPPADPVVSADRVEGMLLGLAIGDALGNTSEGLPPAERSARFGEITDYLPHPRAGGRPVGLPSDDTQLAFWTLESLLEHRRVVPEDVIARFAAGDVVGIGQTVAAALARYRAGQPWWRAAQPSAGNGAVMRIAPVVVLHLGAPSRDLWADAILAGAVTHNDPTSIAACVALVGLLRAALAMPAPPPATWWLETYIAYARPLEGDRRLEARRPGWAYRGPVWRLVDGPVREALAAGRSTREACEAWGSGAYLLETIPSALYILARHAADPEAALVRAVNDTLDSDTVGAIVGAVVGALHGRAALPARWQAGLLGRTRRDDDGRVFELAAAARALVGPGGSAGRRGGPC